MSDLSRRKFVGGAVGAGIALGLCPALLPSAASQQPPTSSAFAGPHALVHPELVPALRTIPNVVVNDRTLSELRNTPAPPPLPAPARQPVARRIPGPKGAPELTLIIVDPGPSEKRRSAYLHIHGGGYVAGMRNTAQRLRKRSPRAADASSFRSTIASRRRLASLGHSKTTMLRCVGSTPMPIS